MRLIPLALAVGGLVLILISPVDGVRVTGAALLVLAALAWLHQPPTPTRF